MSKLPPFEFTALDAIPGTCATIRKTFLSHTTRPVEYRLKQLRKLYWALKDHSDDLTEACRLDIGKPAYETYLSEVGWCLNDIVFQSKNLRTWVKDEKAPDMPLMNSLLLSPRIRKDPMGAVLVIGAYNFPVQLQLGPCIGAISAGCTVVLKPSENAPHTAAVLQKIFAEALDPSTYTVVQGGVPETTALLNEKWDKIFYTGSANVGQIIAKKAAETLTPVTLELGGRNPAIITKNADARLAARRLLWSKIHNAGQVCVSQNYILVDREIYPALITELKRAIDEFYPEGMRKSNSFARIVNKRQFQRLKKLLDESKGKIVIGGTMDEDELYFELTIVDVPDTDDSLIKEETFGPLFSILQVDNLDEAIKIANEVDGTPLGLYPFGNAKETERVLSQVRSGGASVNDGFFHASIPTLAFGGVGTSGQGAYRGKASFDVFTHRRSVTTTPGWAESLIAVRYPPYTAAKEKQYRAISELKPDFDRDGNELGWFGWLFRLGASEKKGGLARWVTLFALVLAARQYLQKGRLLT